MRRSLVTAAGRDQKCIVAVWPGVCRRRPALSYNAVAGQIGRSRCRQVSRKVRTPSGAIAANGRPAILPGKAEDQGHRDESAAGVSRKAHTGTAISVPSVRFVRAVRGRVKRGNLYREQHQIGMRRLRADRAARPSMRVDG